MKSIHIVYIYRNYNFLPSLVTVQDVVGGDDVHGGVGVHGDVRGNRRDRAHTIKLPEGGDEEW